MKGRIIEIFSSIQGEGLWAGRPQVFVRFHGCRLQCGYCDTPLTHRQIVEARIETHPFTKRFESHPLEFTSAELDERVSRFEIPSMALTGGEPLEQADFIQEWLADKKGRWEILLETNGIETEALKKVVSNLSLVSLDLKIPSATGEAPLWEKHREFLQASEGVAHYAKVVYDEKMTGEEGAALDRIMREFTKLQVVFQPVWPYQKRDSARCLALFWGFAKNYPDRVRLVPQLHKCLSIL